MRIISTRELKELIEHGKGYVLIDVRKQEEHRHGMLPTAQAIPIDELEAALVMAPAEFLKKYGFPYPTRTMIIFYCRSGGRSRVAAEIAHRKGLDACSYAGGILEWSKTDRKVKAY